MSIAEYLMFVVRPIRIELKLEQKTIQLEIYFISVGTGY